MTWSVGDEELFAASLANAPQCGPAQMGRIAGLVGLTPVDGDVVSSGELVHALTLSA